MVWAPGHTLQNGKYVIECVLGQGGFGMTYKARHTRLNADVVIKTPNEHLRHDPDYDQYVARFIKEGQMLERLSQKQHPHIVRVRDLFEEGEIPCMVMDFVAGENLFQLVRRRGALPEAEILLCIRQIAEALSVMHQAGLVHRDAHPGNIIVQNGGKAILIDFGIAKELVPSTQSSVGIGGNRGFAPYEQMTGSSSREPNVDVYCLAATLYYAVTGKHPATAFDRKLKNILLKPPKQLKPVMSEWLNQAIVQGMALEAINRPQSMQAWLKLLQTPAPLPQPLQTPLELNTPSPLPQRPQTPTEPQPQKPFSPNQNPIPSSDVSRRSSADPYASHQRQVRSISWLGMTVLLLGYVAIGSISSFLLAPLELWGFTLAFAVAVAWVGTLAFAVTVALVLALVLAWAWAWAGVFVGVWVVAVAWVGAGLLKSFSRLQTLLILVGISFGGLGLGWLVVAGLRLMGVAIPAS
jgi:serine/threonine protein kinase